MALNKAFVGKAYPDGEDWEVTQDATQAYAKAINSANPAYFDGARPGGLMAPPLYGVVFTFQQLMTPVLDPEMGVNIMRLVHGEQDMRWHRPVRPGDKIRSNVTVQSIGEKLTGEVMDLVMRSVNQRDEVVQEQYVGLFIRGRVRKAKDAGDEREESTPTGNILFEEKVTASADQSLRYADASGDHNPIHKDPEMARAAGLPDIILHGLCSMAFVSNVIIEKLAGGNPERLKRLKVRFAKPVMNGDTLTVTVREQPAVDGRKVVGIEVTNPAGVIVIKDGLAEVAL